MFEKIYDSENRNFCLYITIKCNGSKKFRVVLNDYKKPNSKYCDREISVDGTRTIHVNFPVSPKTLAIGIQNLSDNNDSNFEVTLMEGKVRNYNIWMDGKTKRFVQFAINFCQKCGFESAAPNGRKVASPDDEFIIRYYDVITDPRNGSMMSTPARIGHQSGIIDISKLRYDKFTIPMRIMIILHEYSHVYKNPKIGLEIDNEIGADINALYIYLGLGFSKVDAICVFANVFLKAQTKQNIERMRKIMDYITKFENQQYAERN